MDILVEVDNSSSRTVVPKASLHQQWRFQTNIAKRIVSAVLAQTRGQEITAHNSEAQRVMKLQIPRKAAPTIANNLIIGVQYFLKVNININNVIITLERAMNYK